MNRLQLALEVIANEDPEGLLGMGAPADEYETEAEMICDEIGRLEQQSPNGRITREQAHQVVRDIWKQMFGLSDQNLRLREESLALIVNRILGYE